MFYYQLDNNNNNKNQTYQQLNVNSNQSYEKFEQLSQQELMRQQLLDTEIPSPPLQTPPLQTPPLQSPPLQSQQLQTPPLQTPPLQSPPLQSPPLQSPQLLSSTQLPSTQLPSTQLPSENSNASKIYIDMDCFLTNMKNLKPYSKNMMINYDLLKTGVNSCAFTKNEQELPEINTTPIERFTSYEVTPEESKTKKFFTTTPLGIIIAIIGVMFALFIIWKYL